MTAPIIVWRFEDAPENLRNLSTNGGDEDWIAIIPPHLREAYISWIETGSFDSCHTPQVIQRKDGSVVYIGSHA